MTVNSGDKNNWREKYLGALDEQEQLEKKSARQQEILRSALVRVSLAADGQDEALDTILLRLRENLRGEFNALTIGQTLEQVEKAALAFESHRDQSGLDVRTALTELVKSLQSLKLPKGTAKELDSYLSQLPERSKKIRLYPALLQELARIQQQALAEIEQPKTGFLGKLLGTKTADQGKPAGQVVEEEDFIVSLPLPGETAAPAIETTARAVPESAAPAVETPARQDDKNAALAAQIAGVLKDFLCSLENEAAIKTRVSRISAKLAEGMAPELLVPTLETIRDLVMEAYLADNQAFASYLKNVNLELAEIYAVLGGAVKHSQNEREVSRKLQDDMMREMGELESSAATATDLNQLKDRVKSQLGNIRQALDTYQHGDHAQQQLAQQLETLGAKIKTMEVEAEKNRTTLEKHRKKALQDPLTELPNREAYNERATAEVQRWQRYGRPLSVAIFDIDHFKRINDTFGHQAGDRVIKVIGRSIAKRLREVDFFCRYGGEEFVALMPETDSKTALSVLEKVRESIANASFNYKDQPITITVSVGLTEFKSGDDLEAAFERADQALYSAKSSGRNRCQLK
ncbi:diguanylate cyclase [Cellvibrio sp. KY-GH-1]|uniref:sensor domain-containing diguanylate cyclase n=1 Tax=Cellvibrio sp. KY-GH-1 TaxID=2303332 RepID=UPI0012488D56|nr:diguanylate cyclase [Cellvibrio sp. KY-GH-1]QEY17356.1 diguanylate cyclase [Cellvibrio sp. KY-GH-1]